MPAWDAVIVQTPRPVVMKLVPVTVHAPAPEYVIGRPEVVVANGLITYDDALKPTAAGEAAPKVMVCGACVIITLAVCWAAGAKLALPAWLALMTQLPTEMAVTLVPDTEQMVGLPLV